MTKETTEISLVGTLHRIKDNNSIAYQFIQKESPASMNLTMETDDPHKGISDFIYDNARITVVIEVDSEFDFVGHILE